MYRRGSARSARTLLDTYPMLNEQGSTGVNGAAVSTDGELLPRFIISGLFVHASCFVRATPPRRPPFELFSIDTSEA